MAEGKPINLERISRVVINPEGEATDPIRAKRDHGITPDIVFIRDDGWTLGAKDCHRDVAFDMWIESWTHFYRVEDGKIRPIGEYQP